MKRETKRAVFPTHVGVDLITRKSCHDAFSPHTWGWTAAAGLAQAAREFSPHTWGWTVSIAGIAGRRFSPHTWGWTACDPHHRLNVFPTHVGVDRLLFEFDLCTSFPHTRGGGPTRQADANGRFSPHTWGWTDADVQVTQL